MEENDKIKEELISLYQEIKKNIPNNKKFEDSEKNKEINSLTLIENIKELISLLIKSNRELNNGANNNRTSNDKLMKDYSQLENQIIKIENDMKYYLKSFMQYKIQKDSLEMKLNAYMSLEEEYEELKQKVKYEGGKFLENDRKDNEIIIIRSENSSLKKEISKYEIKTKNNDIKIKEYKNKIKELQSSVESLNKKIYNLEKIIKDNTIKNNTININNNNSSVNLRIKNIGKYNGKKKENSNYNSDYNLANLKKIIHLNNSNNKRILPNFHSPKNDYISIGNYRNRNNKTRNNNNNNTNIFTSTYDKVTNGINSRKIIIPIKKEFSLIKQQRNNSISVLRGRDNEGS